MRSARMQHLALSATVVLMLAGCAPVPAQTASPASPPPANGAPAVIAREPARRESAPSAAAVDSAPSPEALRVLAAIPEPLATAQQVPPPPSTPLSSTPATPRRTPVVPAPEAAFDTLRAGTPPVSTPAAAEDSLRASEADTVAVPVPSPTQPLGATPGGTLTMPDTLPPAAPSQAQEPMKPAVPPGSSAPRPNEPCWRLQVAAPAEKPKAESRRDAAQSLLLVPFSITFEKGLYKVRTRDCMTRTAADALKRRATDSGFEGVFVVDTHASAPVRKPAPRATAKKRPRR